ncbi:MAG: hypothetical protein KGL35_10290, partial [Bradyrhizobium sp.]|nr:hypothetical protein [Bradyrhizobium sp.]
FHRSAQGQTRSIDAQLKEMTMPTFRKKPVEIEAWKFEGGWENARKFCAISEHISWCEMGDGSDPLGEIEIETLEGRMTARPGDWIIKGVKGEFYPCKPDIFEATYEAV